MGCNLACPYCHNPAFLATSLVPSVDLQEIKAFLEKRKNLIDGVVMSGGEPTLHAQLPDIVREIKAIGYSVKLDTNGLLPEAIERCTPDYLALDIKTIPDNYKKMLGATYTDVEVRLRKSIGLVRKMVGNAEIRITCAPGIVDKGVIQEIAQLVEGVAQVYLQKMQTGVSLLDPEIAKIENVSDEQMEDYRKIMQKFVGKCVVRGK
jgi:pyruvate formate lyase activating enzyme